VDQQVLPVAMANQESEVVQQVELPDLVANKEIEEKKARKGTREKLEQKETRVTGAIKVMLV
jgi:hypothetical protein